MRALVTAMAMLASLDAAADPRTAPAGFDHNVHARDIDVSGAPAIACTKCHPTTANGMLTGRPGHIACFGSCHGPLPPQQSMPPIAPERLRVCTACHAEAALAAQGKSPTVAYPPYMLDNDFALQIGHKTHGKLACGECHADTRTVRGTPHRRCVGCHDGGKNKPFAMATCATCHTPGSGHPDPPSLLHTADVEIFVTTAFSHQRHAARSAAGRACVTCHAAIIETDDRQLPRPVVGNCAAANCHDGKAAFATTVACTKCHRDVPTKRFKVARPDKRFSHARHVEPKVPKLACTACHPLAKTGEVLVANHAPCAGAACHASDFGKREPEICGACHNGTEPWRALVADRLPAERTEFGATLDHRKHAAACSNCHTLTTAETELRPPRGHRSCMGSGCHATTGGAAPQLSACESCHVEHLAEKRAANRLGSRWSVRATFQHAPHARTKTGDVACTTCHDDLSAPTVLSLATPGKARCAPCHDGTVAFKLTGTACTRCHPGAKR